MPCSGILASHILPIVLAILFWVVVIGFSFVLELHSNAFIAVFIGFGAAISFVLALAGLPFAFQVGAWLAVSAVSLVALRPFAIRKFHHHRFEIDISQPTNTAMTDMRGTVEMPVGDATHPGRVKIQGESWKAVTDWPAQLPDGTPVIVKKAYGTTLWVDPV
jgi:membrane protein implicated in regulation of membrane protease activity